VFSRVLAKKPDDRYQTANDFVQDLEYCLGSWFGSAMDDDTISEGPGASAVLTAATSAAGTRPAVARGGPSTGVRRPTPPPPPPSVAAPPPVAASPEVTEDLPVVHDSPVGDLSALVDEAAEEGIAPTIRLKPGQTPPGAAAPPVEATVLMKSVPPATGRGKGKTAASAPPPVEDEAPVTVVLASADATVRSPSPDLTVKAPSMATVRQPAPAAGAGKVPPPPPPPTATATAPLPPGVAPGPSPAASAPAGAPRKNTTMLLIVGGLAVLMLLGLALGGLAIVRRRGQTATVLPTAPPSTEAASVPTSVPVPPTEAPAVLGALHVESQPPGAAVTVDGQPRGATPLDVGELPLGHHDVKVDLKGYTPAAQAVELGADAPRADVKLTLARLAPVTAVADILSTPMGATIKVDGAVVGRTPLTDFRLKPGSHEVEMSKEGYEPWLQTVTAGPKKLWLDASLKPVARATPAPTAAPEVVDPNKVYAENEVDSPPKKLSGMSASYPTGRAPRLKAGDSVSVTVNFVVSETGQITDLKVVESGGKVLDDEVMSALRDWKYAPGTKRGTKVKVHLVRKFTFKGG
jgi:TonB family protein